MEFSLTQPRADPMLALCLTWLILRWGCVQVDLKATLFKAEEDAKRAKATGTAAIKSKVCVQPAAHTLIIFSMRASLCLT